MYFPRCRALFISAPNSVHLLPGKDKCCSGMAPWLPRCIQAPKRSDWCPGFTAAAPLCRLGMLPSCGGCMFCTVYWCRGHWYPLHACPSIVRQHWALALSRGFRDWGSQNTYLQRSHLAEKAHFLDRWVALCTWVVTEDWVHDHTEWVKKNWEHS